MAFMSASLSRCGRLQNRTKQGPTKLRNISTFRHVESNEIVASERKTTKNLSVYSVICGAVSESSQTVVVVPW